MIAFVGCLLLPLSGRSAPPSIKDFEKWLGPQLPQRTAVQYDRRGIDHVELQVVLGKDIELTPGAYVVTLDEKKLVAADVKKLNIMADRKYLFGSLSLREDGPVIYTFNVAVEGGPLDGATVHLRDGRFPLIGDGEMFVSIYECLYEIPSELAIEVGEIEFNVTRVKLK